MQERWPRPFLPVHLFACVTATGVLAGVVAGAVLGSSHLPTLPVALLEGAVLAGVPAAVLGGVLAGTWALARRVRRWREQLRPG